MAGFRGYLTNLEKYTEGELVGEWVGFPIDEESLAQVMKRIGNSEEVFFTDWDGLDFGEYANIDEINEIAEEWQGEEEKAEAVAEIWNIDEMKNSSPDDFYLYKDITTYEDLGYYWVEELGCYDLKNLGCLANYIDYEAFGRDISFDADGGFSEYGWIEKC